MEWVAKALTSGVTATNSPPSRWPIPNFTLSIAYLCPVDRKVYLVLVHQGIELAGEVFVRLPEREPGGADIESGSVDCVLDWYGVGHPEDGLENGQQSTVFRGGALDVALEDHAHHRLDLKSDDVSRDADNAVAAGAHYRERLVVVAGPDSESVRRAVYDARYLHGIAGSLFHADDIVYLRETERGIVGHVERRPGRDIVQDSGQRGGLGYRLEVLVQPLLGGLIICGHREKQTVRADLLGFYGQAPPTSCGCCP